MSLFKICRVTITFFDDCMTSYNDCVTSKSFFDTKVGNIKDTQKTFDNGIDLLYKSWTGKAKSAAVPVTYNLYKKYTSLIEDADKLSESLNKIYDFIVFHNDKICICIFLTVSFLNKLN